MSTYQLLDAEGSVINTISADQAFVEQHYPGRWVEVETPQPAPTIPQRVTMRQARLVLDDAGLLDAIDATIAALPQPHRRRAEIEWEFSQEVQRHNGFVSQLAPALGLSDAQIDALFVAAAQL